MLMASMKSATVELRAAQWIYITGSAIDDVKLRLAAPLSVHGKVVMERPEGIPATKAPTVFLSPYSGRSPHRAYTMGPRAGPDADGNFDLLNVYPGAYRIRTQGQAPPPYYLDSIRVGEVEATMSEVELFAGAASITVAYKINGGRVTGTVQNCASGVVALVPQNPALWLPGFVQTATCDAGGLYGFAAVRPGEYYVPAFVGIGPLPLNAMSDDGLLDRASRVTVRAGENLQLDLKVTARPE